MSRPRIVVAGAGAIGCFVGGLLTAGGRDVRLLARPRVQAELAERGLRLTGFDGMDLTCEPEVGVEAAMLAKADVVLVCVKTGATAEMAALVAQHSPESAIVVSLQNGLGNAQALQHALPRHDVRAGVVGFNVVAQGEGRFHRSVSGAIYVDAGKGELGKLLAADGLATHETLEINAVQRGKLVMNLTNALNALSGLTLREMLLSRSWRRVMAAQMREALGVFLANGLAVRIPAPAPNWLVPHILRLPDWAFERVAKQMLTVDEEARTSMVFDLAAGKKTEVDALQGEVIRLGAAAGVPTPIAAQVKALVEQAEAGAPLPRLPSDIAL